MCFLFQLHPLNAQNKTFKSKGYISIAGGPSLPVGNYGSYGAGYSSTFQKGYGVIGYFASAEAAIKLKNNFSLYLLGAFDSNNKNNPYFSSDFRNNNPNYNYSNYTYTITTNPNQLTSYFIGAAYTVPIKILLVDFKLGLGVINSSNGSMQSDVVNYYNSYTYSTSIVYSYNSIMQNKTQAAFNGGFNIRYNHTERIGFKFSVDYFQAFSDRSDVTITTYNYSIPNPAITQKVKYSINIVNVGVGIVLNL